MVYFSDITFTAGSKTDRGGLLAGVIWMYNPDTGDLSVFRSPQRHVQRHQVRRQLRHD